MQSWLKQYKQMMFGRDRTEQTMSIAATIKFKNMPDYLYKYRRINDSTLEALERGCLYLSSADKLNDPNEFMLTPEPEVRYNLIQDVYRKMRTEYAYLPNRKVKSLSDINELIVESLGANSISIEQKIEIQKIIEQLQKTVDESQTALINSFLDVSQKSYNICSFTSDLYNELMWAHYAEEHKGFCIEYGFKELGMFNDQVQLMLPVFYEDSPAVPFYNLNDINGNMGMYAFSVKGKCWEYEKEWRLFGEYSEKSYSLKMPKPRAVYAGIRVSDDKMKQLQDVCMGKEVPLYRMDNKKGKIIIGQKV